MPEQPAPSLSTLPAFVPSAVLIGVFALILVLLMPRAASPVVVESTPEVVTPEMTPASASPEAAAAALSLSDDDAVRADFAWACSGCHGSDGSGAPPIGPSFLSSPLLDDPAGLTALLTTASPPVDPALRYPHPYRGGYPVLSDEEIAALVAYLTSG